MCTALQLTLCDLRDDCVNAVRDRFAAVEAFVAEKGDITRQRKDAWATAGNSFGDMGGGVDKAIDTFFSRRAAT